MLVVGMMSQRDLRF